MADHAAPAETAADAREGVHEVPAPWDDVAAALCARFERAVFVDSHGQPVVHLDRADWYEAVTHLRDEERFTTCLDVCAVDHLVSSERLPVPGVDLERFEVVANFLSHPRNRRIRLISQLPAEDPTIASVTPLYPGANFAERETYDLFGVVFEGHPDLTRILMPDEWVGHPLRKDDAPAGVPVTFKGDPGPR